MNWLRLWIELYKDKKIRSLPVEQRWLWVVILMLARESEQPGRLVKYGDVPMSIVDFALAAGISNAAANAGVAAFMRNSMLYKDGEVFVVTNWKKRQPDSVSSTPRVQAYRDRIRLQGETVTGYTKHKDSVFERDGQACVYCSSDVNLCLDHSVPIVQGGDHEEANLVTACKRCNSGKAGRTPEQAGYQFINPEAESRYKANVQRLKRLQQGGAVTLPEAEAEAESEAEKEEPAAAARGTFPRMVQAWEDDAPNGAVDTCGIPFEQYNTLRETFSHEEIACAKAEVEKRTTFNGTHRWDRYLVGPIQDARRRHDEPAKTNKSGVPNSKATQAAAAVFRKSQ